MRKKSAPLYGYCGSKSLITRLQMCALLFISHCIADSSPAHSQQFRLALPGSVSRSATEKMSDAVYVEDFGANGNDQNDDSKAFQAAIDAVKGRTIYLQGGTYYCNINLNRSNIKIDGNGSVLKPFNTQLPVITIGADKSITDIHLSFFEIDGNRQQADGILIHNDALAKGSDYLAMDRLIINYCRIGVKVTGRTIWSRFTNCRFNWNRGGFQIKTNLPCNLLYFATCTFNQNAEYGLWVENQNADSETFKTFQFSSCNFENNGMESSKAYGAWFSGVESLLLENIYCENNGTAANESYGIKITGPVGRGLSILGGWYVGSKYPIYIDGEKKWGMLLNVTAESVLKNKQDIFLFSNWANDEPKIEVWHCMGGIITKHDNNGNLPVNGLDWVATDATKLSMQNRNWLKIFANGRNQQVRQITGLIPGKTIGLFNYSPSGNSVQLDAGLMFDNKPLIIPPNKAIQFMVDGYPTPGKLIPLTQ